MTPGRRSSSNSAAMAHQLAAAKPSAEPRKDALVSDSSHSRTSP